MRTGSSWGIQMHHSGQTPATPFKSKQRQGHVSIHPWKDKEVQGESDGIYIGMMSYRDHHIIITVKVALAYR